MSNSKGLVDSRLVALVWFGDMLSTLIMLLFVTQIADLERRIAANEARIAQVEAELARVRADLARMVSEEYSPASAQDADGKS